MSWWHGVRATWVRADPPGATSDSPVMGYFAAGGRPAADHLLSKPVSPTPCSASSCATAPTGWTAASATSCTKMS